MNQFPLGSGSAKSARGFTMVEVAMSLGIVAFAFTALLGMLPVGLDLFRSAMDTSVTTLIVQKVSGDLQQGELDSAGLTPETVLYFDEQGNQVDSAAKSLYWTQIQVFANAVLPGSTATSNSEVTRIVIQVAHNPGGMPLTTDAAGVWEKRDGVTLIKRAFFLAKNCPNKS